MTSTALPCRTPRTPHGPYLPPGFSIQGGRLTRVHRTRRPPWIWPEIWKSKSVPQREQCLRDGEPIEDDADDWEQPAAAAAVPVPGQDAGDSIGGFPAMPTVSGNTPHREKVTPNLPLFDALVARSLKKPEIARTPAAQKALNAECDKLRAARCWDESDVREWSTVANAARTSNSKAHFCRLFEICVEKGSELPRGHADRKFKGRVVLGGNNVTDEVRLGGQPLPGLHRPAARLGDPAG